METSIIKIGNSKGIIIPNQLLGNFLNCNHVNLVAKDKGIYIFPGTEKKPRSNWEQQFEKAVADGFKADELPNDFANDFDQNDWTW